MVYALGTWYMPFGHVPHVQLVTWAWSAWTAWDGLHGMDCMDCMESQFFIFCFSFFLVSRGKTDLFHFWFLSGHAQGSLHVQKHVSYPFFFFFCPIPSCGEAENLLCLWDSLAAGAFFFREKRHFWKNSYFWNTFLAKNQFFVQKIFLSLKTILTSLPLKNQYWRNFFRPKLIVFWSSYDQIPFFHALFHHFWHCTCNLWLEDKFFRFPGVQTRFSYGFCLCLLKMSCLAPIPCSHKFSRQI